MVARPSPRGGGRGYFVRYCGSEVRWDAGLLRCRVRRNQGGGGGGPLEAGRATERWPTPEEEAEEVKRAGMQEGEGGLH